MKKLVLVLGIASMLFSCSNKETEQEQAQQQIDSINRALDRKLFIINNYSAKYDGDSVKMYRAYYADSIGMSTEQKENYINK